MEKIDKTFLENIGALYREMRAEKGLTQRQAAKLAKSTQARISDIELGRADVQILTLQKWAMVYGWQVEFNVVPYPPVEEVVPPTPCVWEVDKKQDGSYEAVCKIDHVHGITPGRLA